MKLTKRKRSLLDHLKANRKWSPRFSLVASTTLVHSAFYITIHVRPVLISKLLQSLTCVTLSVRIFFSNTTLNFETKIKNQIQTLDSSIVGIQMWRYISRHFKHTTVCSISFLISLLRTLRCYRTASRFDWAQKIYLEVPYTRTALHINWKELKFQYTNMYIRNGSWRI